MLEARRKIGDAYRAAIAVDELGHHDGGVAHVIRADLDLAVEHHVGEAFFLVTGQEPTEHGVAVVARQAPPHDAPARLDQSRGAAVADDGEVERGVGHDG